MKKELKDFIFNVFMTGGLLLMTVIAWFFIINYKIVNFEKFSYIIPSVFIGLLLIILITIETKNYLKIKKEK